MEIEFVNSYAKYVNLRDVRKLFDEMLINNVKALFLPGVIVYALVHKLQELGVYCIIMSNNFQLILVP